MSNSIVVSMSDELIYYTDISLFENMKDVVGKELFDDFITKYALLQLTPPKDSSISLESFDSSFSLMSEDSSEINIETLSESQSFEKLKNASNMFLVLNF